MFCGRDGDFFVINEGGVIRQEVVGVEDKDKEREKQEIKDKDKTLLYQGEMPYYFNPVNDEENGLRRKGCEGTFFRRSLYTTKKSLNS